jgi:NAD(P)-dependent dehydrogenase (short-subunit alcohol dehydrogenase family)
MDQRADINGRVAVVTGGSRGIGLAVAEAFVGAGASVLITGRDRVQLEAASRRLGAARTGAGVIAVQADVRQPAEAARAVDCAADRFGGLDVLVNNAGVGRFGDVADMTVDDWQDVIATNLSGVFYCSRAAIPHMRSRGGGWIINISSLASTNPSKGSAAYCASKAGLNAFTDALMQEVRYDNIRVSAVLPGSVSTGFAFRGSGGEADWKIAPEHIAGVVLGLITFPSRSLPSRVDVRPARPGR